MSSHHFVKEQQEPALLLLSIENEDLKNLPDLLEWVPTVLVTQWNVHKIMSMGIKIDGIIADSKFQEAHALLLEEQHPVKFITTNEKSFLEAAMDYLKESNHHAVNILSFDPLTSDLLSPYLANLDIVFFSNSMRYFPAKNGRINKWLPEGSIQVHGKDGQFVEHHSPLGSTVFPIQYVTFIEVKEGMHHFSSNALFWLGTLT
jgi:hypothetical protein